MIKILSKKMLGDRCSGMIKNLVIAGAVYLGLSSGKFQIDISLNVFLFTMFFFVTGVMVQILGSDDNAKYLKGFFMLPFERKRMVGEYCTILSVYTLTARVSLLLSMYFAFTKPDITSVIMISLDFIFACLSSMIIYAFLKTKIYISALVFVTGVCTAFLVKNNITGIIIYAVLITLVVIPVIHTDPYRFIKRTDTGLKINKQACSGNFLVQKYLFRYILSNKKYVINSAAIIAFGCFFVKMFEETGVSDVTSFLPTGMALISINTPFAIVISSNKKLREKLDVLPGKMQNFCIPYALTISVFYLICYALYLTAMYFLGIKANIVTIVTAFVFAIESSSIVCLLENKFPIRNWSVETELWHNKRKYIIPVVLMLESFLLQI